MNEVAQSTVFVRSEDMLASDMDGEVVMMSIERGEYYGLNTVGTRIWQALEQPVTVAEIVAMICADFEVEREPCERDVRAFLEDCRARSMVAIVGSHAD